MGHTTLIECQIDPMDTTPVQIRPYKLSFEEQRKAGQDRGATAQGDGDRALTIGLGGPNLSGFKTWWWLEVSD
jgi:hypothetical protein